jgi:hypothetical protein
MDGGGGGGCAQRGGAGGSGEGKAAAEKPFSVLVIPRPTAWSVNPFRSSSPVELDLELMESKFDMRLSDAAKSLGISTTSFKQVCRKLGIARWPRRPKASSRRAESDDDDDDDFPQTDSRKRRAEAMEQAGNAGSHVMGEVGCRKGGGGGGGVGGGKRRVPASEAGHCEQAIAPSASHRDSEDFQRTSQQPAAMQLLMPSLTRHNVSLAEPALPLQTYVRSVRPATGASALDKGPAKSTLDTRTCRASLTEPLLSVPNCPSLSLSGANNVPWLSLPTSWSQERSIIQTIQIINQTNQTVTRDVGANPLLAMPLSDLHRASAMPSLGSVAQGLWSSQQQLMMPSLRQSAPPTLLQQGTAAAPPVALSQEKQTIQVLNAQILATKLQLASLEANRQQHQAETLRFMGPGFDLPQQQQLSQRKPAEGAPFFFSMRRGEGIR